MQWPLCADTRSLVAFRIALGCVLAAEAAWLLPNARDLLSDNGLLPLRAMHAMYDEADDPGANRWSLCWASGGVWWQWVLLAALLCCGICIAVGFRTNIATGSAWVIMASVHRRNPLMVHGGDVLLRMMLLLATFAPLDHGSCTADETQPTSTQINSENEGTAAQVNVSTGSRTNTSAETNTSTSHKSDMSITTKMSPTIFAGQELTNGDTAHKAVQELSGKACEVKTVGVAALMLQPLLMYHTAGALKNGLEWREEFTAVYFAMRLSMVTKSPAELVLQFPEFVRFASMLVPPLEEFIGPLLLLCPLAPLRTPARILAVCIFTLMQTGFFLTMVLGTFPWISTVSLLTFVPGEVWDTVLPIADSLGSATRRKFLWVTTVLHQYRQSVGTTTAFVHEASSVHSARSAKLELFGENSARLSGLSGTQDTLAAVSSTERNRKPAGWQACSTQKGDITDCQCLWRDCIWSPLRSRFGSWRMLNSSCVHLAANLERLQMHAAMF